MLWDVCLRVSQSPLEELHRKDIQGFKDVFCAGNGIGNFPKGVGTTGIEIVRRITEYSGLDLSQPSDVLRGMLGILGAFRRGRLGIQNCLGTPILPAKLDNSKKQIEGWTPTL
jgi:1-acyl-sn-glycerol-3-phosphate acyltransferase